MMGAGPNAFTGGHDPRLPFVGGSPLLNYPPGFPPPPPPPHIPGLPPFMSPWSQYAAAAATGRLPPGAFPSPYGSLGPSSFSSASPTSAGMGGPGGGGGGHLSSHSPHSQQQQQQTSTSSSKSKSPISSQQQQQQQQQHHSSPSQHGPFSSHKPHESGGGQGKQQSPHDLYERRDVYGQPMMMGTGMMMGGGADDDESDSSSYLVARGPSPEPKIEDSECHRSQSAM